MIWGTMNGEPQTSEQFLPDLGGSYRLVERQKAPVPGIRTVVVRRPLLLLLTRSGPAPSEPVRPRLDAVRRTGPSLSDLRKPKLMSGPYALTEVDLLSMPPPGGQAEAPTCS